MYMPSRVLGLYTFYLPFINKTSVEENCSLGSKTYPILEMIYTNSETDCKLSLNIYRIKK